MLFDTNFILISLYKNYTKLFINSLSLILKDYYE